MSPKFGSALGALLLIASIGNTNAYTIEKRALAVSSKLPGSWTSKGCYVDVGRTLTDGGFNDNLNMTATNCINYCAKQGSIYAGTEYGQECYCGMTIASAATTAATADCSVACSGNATEPCGGGNRLNLYWSGTTGPQTNPGPGLWKFAGCYTEGTTGRTLVNGVGTTGGSGAMTVELCTSACKASGYNLAGAEYGGECYCGNAISNGATLAPEGVSGCNKLCNGNFSEYCGNGNRLDIYNYNNAVVLPPYTTVSSSTVSSSSTRSSSSSSSVRTTTTSSSSRATTSSSSTRPTTSSSSTRPTTSSSSTRPTTSSSSTRPTTSSTSTRPTTSSTSSSTRPTTSSSSTRPTTSSTSSSTRPTTSSTSSSIPSSSSSIRSTTSSTSSSVLSSSSTTSAPARATTLSRIETIGAYSYQGCYTEGTGVRALAGAASYDYVGMTLEKCATACAAFTYFGVEYGGECYCGNTLGVGSVSVALSDCSFTCPGNALEYCGAGNRLEMYKVGPAATSSSSSVTSSATLSSTSGTVSSVTISSSTSTSSAPPLGTGFPTGWSDQGCWVDGVAGRILSYQQNDDAAMTQQSCVNKCVGLGYTIAGMEYGQQCFCDNFVYNGGAKAALQTDCNMPCAGNAAQTCGSGGRMTLYSKGTPVVYAPPAPQTTGLPTGWVYKGCLEDNIASVENPNEQLPTFPYKVWDNQINTPTSCIAQCQTYGFSAAGLEYGSQCFCGDPANIDVASAPGTNSNPAATQYYTRSRKPLIVADARCEAACTGDKTHLCGAGNLLTYYSFEATTPLNKWDFPTGNAAGKFEMLIGGLVVPLMTAQNINGKVSFIEKFGSGEPNGTGAYELDPTLSGNFNKAWRAMTGLQTDVFCSAGVILPDKAGRQLTIGGWAGESNFGVRLYTPDGSTGVNGTNGWVEDKANLKLQVARWYPSALIMANGSILVVGGEIGSNADQQPTLELLPATGVPDAGTVSGYSNTTRYLDFLQRTHPFNLYPFVTVVPSGIFIAYYNEARILDEKTFNTKTILPNMPGAVNDPKAGRTYQLEGTMVTLPQVAPYTKNMEVLICGGSTEGAAEAVDNCVSTAPEDGAAAVWTIERMPSRRVLPCMAGLPDGTYVILNGASHGVAGFGLASSPNGNAVIYDPSKPKTQRMSVMANTTIARLYHSEAIVMLDGRVLVTGSDPTGDYTQPVGNYPEEHRVEVFIPPYLMGNPVRPTFTITNKDWTYNQAITFTTGTAITAANLKVTLLGAVVSTHGNSMGQRTIVPAVSCTGTTCTVTAPPDAHTAPPGWFMMFVLNGPTPSVGQFVRIGGDPAELGSWPKFPTFTLPGV